MITEHLISQLNHLDGWTYFEVWDGERYVAGIVEGERTTAVEVRHGNDQAGAAGEER